jgi:2-polyprenyl-3-methyl-5-hydroxy-6-metoxy-1,4-benzoquinol methylase
MVREMMFGLRDKFEYFECAQCGCLQIFVSSILDIGCGTGKLLLRIRRDGFSNLTGYDPLKNGNRYFENHRRPIFAKEQIEAFKEKAIELNKKNDGDQACFYLYKN